MSRLTRDGLAEPVSRDQILRHERGQGNIHFPYSADHEQDRQPCPVDPYSCYMCDHTYIHTTLPVTPPTATLQSCLWSLRIFPSLPGSRLRFFIAKQVQHSYTPCRPMVMIEFYLLTFLTPFLSATEARIKETIVSRIELPNPH